MEFTRIAAAADIWDGQAAYVPASEGVALTGRGEVDSFAVVRTTGPVHDSSGD